MRPFFTLSLIVALSGCAASETTAPAKPGIATVEVRRTAATQAIDEIAASYLRLTLEIGTHEAGYIDAYYGPPELKTAAEAAPRDKPALLSATRALMAQVDVAARRISDPLERRRAAFLRAQLRAAETRLMMMQGTRFAFADEAERLFGVRPRLKPLASYDGELAKIAALVPGEGALADRVETYLDAFTIPKGRLQKTFDAAIARCRGRSMAHIPMPDGESFRLEFVTGKSWSGYNYYQGGYHSLIQVNTDLPIRLSRALDLGCHEGYPGHHLLNMKLEEKLVKERGWREFSVYPLYSPQSLIAEGSANYGIDLAFPGSSKADTERDILMPIAEIAVPADDRYWQLLAAIKRASGARLTIAQQYLDGEIDRAAAVALTQKYLLVSRERAEQSISFTDQYRSYVINYGLGEAMVRAHVERGKPGRDVLWQRMEKLVSEPTLPADLLAR
ncbi:hypothetical protein [Sphingopyxis sp. RIFCSPHIGHO2_12_FULL_65_19]|uniref:hypothetical protein n=1 Tax=Sphingopyxis sp. RIFCSPHIGHO2_12_FULL_65_19 TaxID=1802172 RepID=UPI0008B28291|nr:hypothetical protein [Sphingopyxis sp. RIFCSPHIGHO2_12_FULL_65_19]OHD09734.1 MAG: hypothetical protein A3E77_00790 [Sphingopyxis sp. RIFCSPHIGHO2_12_FULL_65_19]